MRLNDLKEAMAMIEPALSPDIMVTSYYAGETPIMVHRKGRRDTIFMSPEQARELHKAVPLVIIKRHSPTSASYRLHSKLFDGDVREPKFPPFLINDIAAEAAAPAPA